MKILILIIVSLLGVHGGNGQIREDFIIEGTETLEDDVVKTTVLTFGSSWRGPSGGTPCISFQHDPATTVSFGEPTETFQFIPPGTNEELEIIFELNPVTFIPPIFLISDSNDARVCDSVTKQFPSFICIDTGDPSCNGRYQYSVTVGDRYDFAYSDIVFVGGQPPVLFENTEVISPAVNTFSGTLGATFKVAVDGSNTVLIEAADIQGEPLGNIEWYFTAQGTSNRIPLPGSLSGVTIEDSNLEDGRSILRISGISTVHLGEYTAIATNENGQDTASAYIVEGVGPFIQEGSGESQSNSFRVGADRAANLGETITIRAEDRQSDPSSTITWSYSQSESGPYSAITTGGAYTISSVSGGNNIGTDSSLLISNVQPGQFGYYRAIATNAYGTDTSTTSLIGATPVLREGSSTITSGSGDIGTAFLPSTGSTISIVASDTAGFTDSTYTWQLFRADGSSNVITTGGRYQVIPSVVGGRPISTLTITGVTENELGTYRATATNPFGQTYRESLVGRRSTCRSGTSITRVNTGDTVVSAGNFDTTNANNFRLVAQDVTGVPTGTVSFQYSRTPNGPRSSLDSQFAIAATPIGNQGEINFINVADSSFPNGYYFVTITNQFGTSSECISLVGSRLEFRSGSGQIGEDYQIGIGNSLEITAEFIDGFPLGGITWTGPNGPISSSTPGYTIVEVEGFSILSITSARDGIDFGDYTVASSNVFGGVSVTSTVRQSQVVVPPKIDAGTSETINTDGAGSIGDSFETSSGQLITIRANDIAGQEASTIRWSRIVPGGNVFQEITSNGLYTITSERNAEGFTESVLSFFTGPETYGTYRAEASNSVGADAAISNVGQPPRVPGRLTLTRIPSGQSRTIQVGAQVSIAESGSVTLTATDTEGQPTRDFIWTYRDNPSGPFVDLPGSVVEQVSGNVGTITINRIDRSQYGEYRVVASNNFGESIPVVSVIGAPPIIRFSTGRETDGMGEIGNDFVIPSDRRLTITACVIGGYPPADTENFRFEEQGVELESVQQEPPNENCFIYQEGEFEITCGTTITARTENIFGVSNQPSSSIVFPPPTIVPGSQTCNTGTSISSAQIGSDLCLYETSSFDITCSLERTNIPNFSLEWQFAGRSISSGGKYSISNPSLGTSILSVTGVTVDDTGRYGCLVTSVCGEDDAESTEISTYDYEYVCSLSAGRVQCFESVNGGSQTTVSNDICDSLGLLRPPCAACEWVVSQWSDCSDNTCHRGRRVRDVFCECDRVRQEDSECLNTIPKPEDMDRCGPLGIRCNRPFEWREYSFSTCSATCGVSFRSRRVECVSSITFNQVSDEDCNLLFKPLEDVSCAVPLCGACADTMSQENCELFISLVGNCDPHPYYTRSQCCQTCRRMGF